MELQGRIAIVTGAAVGLGRAIALRLASDGATVVVADVDVPDGAETARQIGAQGGKAAFVRADMTEPGDVASLVETTRAGHGGLDVLVNNAGGGGHIPPHFPAADVAAWGATLDLNLRGAMIATQHALAAMGGEGVVVNVASSAALGVEPYASPEYAAAKAGLIRFTTALARHNGVRVTCVVPGWIATARAEAELAAMRPAERAAAPVPIPPDRITAAIVALILDEDAAGRVVELRAGA